MLDLSCNIILNVGVLMSFQLKHSAVKKGPHMSLAGTSKEKS